MDDLHSHSASSPDNPLEHYRRLLAGAEPPTRLETPTATSLPRTVPDDGDAMLWRLLESALPCTGEQAQPHVARAGEIPTKRIPVVQVAVAARPPAWQFDSVLMRVQQLLLLGAVLAAGYWFANGPLYDWHNTPSNPSAERQGSFFANLFGSALNADAARFTTQWLPIVRAPAPLSALSVQALPTIPPPPVALPTPTIVPTPEPVLPSGIEPNHLIIPAIGVDTPVVEVFVVGDEWEVAEYAAGYMHGTARAGEPGNMGIMGHLGLRGGVFANLPALQPGADIYVDAGNQRYHYRMRGSQVVDPTQLEVLYPEEMPTLTLITCANWDTQRLIVTADWIGTEPLP